MLRPIAISTCLPAKPGLLERFKRHRQATPALSSLLQRAIPLMAPSTVTAPAVAAYPWCFVAPADVIRGKHYFIGAFLPEVQTTAGLPAVLYALVSESWLLGQLSVRDCLPFWLARVLALQMTTSSAGHDAAVHHWCQLLQRMLANRRQGRAYATRQRLREGLREARCDADFALGSEHGVDVMPWMAWPGCIQNDETIWLWRQSRHGKVIESQKISQFEFE